MGSLKGPKVFVAVLVLRRAEQQSVHTEAGNVVHAEWLRFCLGFTSRGLVLLTLVAGWGIVS